MTRTATLSVNPPAAALHLRWRGWLARASVPARPAPPLSLSVTAPVEGALPAGTPRRISLYTPELQLMAESETSSAAQPQIAYEYVWFGGQPLTQLETPTGAVHYYFNDHLGTPLLTTDAAGAVDWRIEREPYGTAFTFRAGATRHQPLAFPGQEEGGETALSYNIFRWYRSSFGRYTQSDPVGLQGGLNLYSYVGGNPVSNIDPKGLAPIGETKTNCPCITCPSGNWYQYGGTVSGMFKFVGAGVSVYRFRCPSGRLQCDFLTVCGKGGAGVFGSAVLGGGFTLFAYCESELSGWSFGPDVDLGYGYAGSASASIGKAGTFGVTVEPGGIGGGAAGGISVCYAFKLGCRKY